MTDLITTATLNLRARDEEGIAVRAQKASAFQTAATRGSMDLRGKLKRALAEPEADFSVAEGATKTVVGADLTETVVLPSKKAYVVVLTEETEEAMNDVVTAFINYAPGVFAREYDLNLAGLKADSNGKLKSLRSLVNTTEVELTSAADLKGAFGTHLAVADMPTAWVLSTSLYGEIVSLDATESDRKLSNELLTSRTLLGLPVHTFRSAERVGFLRDFENDEWAIVGDEPLVVRKDAGTIEDSQGVVHNLTQENKVAYILEGFYSYYADPSAPLVVVSGSIANPEA